MTVMTESSSSTTRIRGHSRATVYSYFTSLDLSQTQANRVADDAGSVRRVELLHDPGPVGLDGLGADHEELGDLLRRLALGDKLQHLAFPRRQRIDGQRRLRQVRLHQGARDSRAQVHHARQDLVDRSDQIRGRLGQAYL